MSEITMNKSKSPKEMYVRVMSTPSNNNAEIDLSKIKNEYDKEGAGMKRLNIFSGGGAGACIGLIACVASISVGVPISLPEAFTLVSGSLMFGVVAGYILY